MKGYINMMKLLVELSTRCYSSVCISEYRVSLNLVCLEAVLKIRREILTAHHFQKSNHVEL